MTDVHARATDAAYALGRLVRANCCEGEPIEVMWAVEMHNGDWSAIIAPGERERHGTGAGDHGPLSEAEARQAWEQGLAGWPLSG